ncbi:MAG: TAXI family TRAP transporter solute-binding subunit [Desulfobacterales bacterium]|nr:TAXI family TRAP transporter solute-binding subunit [Desulfobacterales bacterium]
MKRAFMIITFSLLMAFAGIFAQIPSALAANKARIGAATIAPTMSTYPAMVALTDFLNKNTNLDITLSSVAGSTAIATSVEQMSETGMGMGFSLPIAMVVAAYHGTIEYQGKPNKSLRMMYLNFWEYSSMYTTPGTGITDLSQAKGKRFPLYTRTRNAHYPPVFDAYGIDYNKDLKLIKVPSPDASAKALSLGKLDIAGGTIAGGKIIAVAEAAGGVLVLPIDPKKFAAAKAKYPMDLVGFNIVMLPPGEVPGVINKEPTPVMDFKLTSFAHKDLPNAVVYACVKAILDNAATVQGLHRELKKFSLDTVAPVINVPYHPGAVKALKEKGIWTATHEKMQQDLLK